MKTWNRITIDKSNKISEVNKVKDYKDFSDEMGGYDSSEHYKSKKRFFEYYFLNRYKIWDNYLKNNLKPNEDTLATSSGRAINELNLISNNFNITCSDLEIPQCYKISKKLHRILKETYQEFGYKIITVPTNSVEKRADFVISSLQIMKQIQITAGF